MRQAYLFAGIEFLGILKNSPFFHWWMEKISPTKVYVYFLHQDAINRVQQNPSEYATN